MLKKIMLVAAFATLTFCAQAQEKESTESLFKFGVKAGYSNFNFDYIREDDIVNSTWEDYDINVPGFFVGVSTDIKLNNSLHLEPSILYSRIKKDWREHNVLMLPVMAKYYFAGTGFNIQAGPQLTWIMDNFNRKELGLDLGLAGGYDINEHFFIEARYNWNLTDRWEDNYSELKVNNFHVGVGYRF